MKKSIVTRAMREERDLRAVREGRVIYPRSFGRNPHSSSRLVKGGEYVKGIPRELNPLINAIAKGDKSASTRFVEKAYSAGHDVHTITDALIEGVRRWPKSLGKEKG